MQFKASGKALLLFFKLFLISNILVNNNLAFGEFFRRLQIQGPKHAEKDTKKESSSAVKRPIADPPRNGSARTKNFIVSASTPELAREVANEAERVRGTLAIEWLGKELPDWELPVPIRATCGANLPARGDTRYKLGKAMPYDFDMKVEGSRELLLDACVPHEVLHTVLASHFNKALPRWIDEGVCTTSECKSEREKYNNYLIRFLNTDRGIAFDRMFNMENYPSDILPLYSQGHSLVEFLLEKHDKKTFIRFVEEGLDKKNWANAVDKYYGHKDLSGLQTDWLNWVKKKHGG